MGFNKSASDLGKLSAKKQKRALGIAEYKKEMVKRGKSGAVKRWKAHRAKLSTVSVGNG